MEIGTQIKMTGDDDGREATVIYNSLIGVGVKWGLHDPQLSDFEGTNGDTVDNPMPDNFEWEPEALLREPWTTCESHGFTAEQCAGENYEITRYGLKGDVQHE